MTRHGSAQAGRSGCCRPARAGQAGRIQLRPPGPASPRASSRSCRRSPRCCSRSARGRRCRRSAASTTIRRRSSACRASGALSIRTSSASCRCGPTSSWSYGTQTDLASSSSARISRSSTTTTAGSLTSPHDAPPRRAHRRADGGRACGGSHRTRAGGGPRHGRRPAAAADAARSSAASRLAARHLRERRRRLPARHARGRRRRQRVRRREAAESCRRPSRRFWRAPPEVILELRPERGLVRRSTGSRADCLERPSLGARRANRPRLHPRRQPAAGAGTARGRWRTDDGRRAASGEMTHPLPDGEVPGEREHAAFAVR